MAINFREWDVAGECWVNNTSLDKQREFLDKFYKRCSHSYERPSMVDRGIQVFGIKIFKYQQNSLSYLCALQIILNSTNWEKESHTEVYKSMKRQLGLAEEDEGLLGVIINTCMTPWLRAQKTFQRMSVIIRNELYNAYGAVSWTENKLSYSESVV